jgi:hypothetical protein
MVVDSGIGRRWVVERMVVYMEVEIVGRCRPVERAETRQRHSVYVINFTFPLS